MALRNPDAAPRERLRLARNMSAFEKPQSRASAVDFEQATAEIATDDDSLVDIHVGDG